MFNKNETKSKKSFMEKWQISFGLIGIFLLAIVASGCGGEPITENKQEAQSTTEEEISNAFKLASLEIGNNNPSSSLVNTFDNLLKELTKKCPKEDETQIANYIFKTKKMINEKGRTITLLQAGNGINESIPKEATGVVNCAEIAAAFVVLLTSQ